MTLHSPMCPKLYGHIGKTFIRPSRPQSIWIFWVVAPRGRMGSILDEKNSQSLKTRKQQLLLLHSENQGIQQSCLACAVFVSFRSFICISICHCFLQQTSNGSSRKEMYLHTYIYIYAHIYIFISMFLYVQRYFS